jgi:hypothetical protein
MTDHRERPAARRLGYNFGGGCAPLRLSPPSALLRLSTFSALLRF